MKVLGIETSCDETAAAVVENGDHLLSNTVASSLDLHVPYGGVVPEIAARSHIEVILPIIDAALREAHLHIDAIDALAVTQGPGLGGSLLIGVLTARTLALAYHKPIFAINHVTAHVYANFITASNLPGYALPSSQPQFPLLALIVSGNHTQIVLFHGYFNHQLLGQTHDDAIGEAFDKVAKMFGLPYPGGPSIARWAVHGDANRYQLPKAKLTGHYDFSFSGLKTATLRIAQAAIGADFTLPSYELASRLSDTQKADIAASFQRVAIETVVDKTVGASQEFQPRSIVIAGGVAASAELRRQLADRLPVAVSCPDLKLCTDNAVMVATLGCFKARFGQTPADPYALDIEPNLSM